MSGVLFVDVPVKSVPAGMLEDVKSSTFVEKTKSASTLVVKSAVIIKAGITSRLLFMGTFSSFVLNSFLDRNKKRFFWNQISNSNLLKPLSTMKQQFRVIFWMLANLMSSCPFCKHV